MKFILFSFLIVWLTLFSNGQPTATFSIQSSLCLEERLSLSNESVNAVSYEWDFCFGDLSSAPAVSTLIGLTGVNNPQRIKVVEDSGEWYGFVSSRNQNSLVRIAFGETLENPSPTVSNIPISGLNKGDGFILEKESGEWVGFLLSSGNNKLFRLTFGSDLNSTPSIEDLGGIGSISSPRGLDHVEAEGVHYLIASNITSDTYTVLNFGSSVTTDSASITAFTSDALLGADLLVDLEVEYEGGEFYGYGISFGNNTVHRMSFGSSLMQNPVSIDNYTFTELNSPLDIAIVNEGSLYYGLVTSNSGGDLVRLSLGELSAEEAVTVLTIPTSLAAQSVTIVENGTSYMGFSVNSTATLSSLVFDASCSVNIYTSSDFEPSGVYYSSPGEIIVGLTAIDAGGVRRTALDTVTVTADTAPISTFTIDPNRCISNPNTFTPSITGLTSYSWDFNNDGIEDSNAESPQVLFDTLGGPGTYTVRVEVSDGACNNFYEEEVTIYNEPPAPSFTISTSGSFCTNNEFTLANTTDETGYDDVLTYQWVIDGDVVNQKDTVYTFSTSGVKTITLQSFLPGCSSTITSEDISVDEGPEASFSYTNNCFGEAISFTSEVVGDNITGYAWDFGDGEGTSAAQDTVYQYSTAGDYTVSLSVTNASGCTTTFTRELEINDQPLADFSFGEAIENLPVEFSGIDLTMTYDSIVSWNWDFDGLGSDTDRSPSFTFSVGNYDISLSAETAQGCLEVVTKSIEVRDATYPTPQFSIQSSLCLEERLSLSNESVNAVSYEWDFCFGDLSSAPAVSTLIGLTGVNNPQRIKVVEDSGEWYGFVSSRNQNSLVRIAFGETLENPSPTVSNIPISGLSNGDGFVLEKESGEWVGFLLSSGNNKLFRLTFGSDLNSTPSIEDLGGIGSISSPRGLDHVEAEGVHYLIASNITSDTYTVLNFGSSVTTDSASITAFTSDALLGADLLVDLEVEYEGGEFYGYGISFGNNTVHRMSFGSSLMQNPVSIDNYTFTELNSPLDIAIVNEGSLYYGLVTSNSGGDLVRLSLGELSAEEAVTVLTIPTSLAAQSVTIVENGTSYMGFSVNSTATLSSLVFDASCSVNIYTSSDFEPSGVYYSSPGEIIVGLTAIDAGGVRRTALDTVTVTADTASISTFTIDPNRCISNPNTFTPSITGLTSYSWDFNNDGIEDSNAESPQVLFDTLGGPGTYTVRVEVSDGACNNFYEEEVTIYNEPPAPSFTISTSGSFCTNNEFTLANTTDETGYDDVLTYQWVIDGDVVNQKDTVYTFSTSGVKTITLQSFLPGCSSTITSEDISVDEGPEASFSYTNNCFGEAISFTSEVVGDNITGYAWDFGDGEGTSAAQDTVYQYSTAGDYTVSLSVTNASGCTTTFTRELEINDQPLADFSFGEAIENLPVEFSGIDLTMTYDSIVSWNWDFDGLGSDTDRSPSFTFSVGNYDISLSAETAQGCLEVVTKSIEVRDATYPTPQFSIQSSLCLEERLSLSNESVNAVSYEWDFCFGDLSSAPAVSTLIGLTGVNNPQRIKVVEDSGEWYGFVSSRNQNSLVRIAFGETLENPSPTVSNIPISGLSNGDGFVLEKESGEWVGFLLSSGNNKLFRLTFGSDLNSTPSIEDLGGIGSISSPRGLDHVEAEGVHYLIASNITSDTYTVLNFGSSVTTDSASITAFTSDALLGADLLVDLEVEYEGGEFYGYGISFGNNTVHRMSFGSSLMQNPVSIDNYTFTELNSPLDIAIVNEGSLYYGLVTSNSGGDLVRLSLGELSAEEAVTVLTIPTSLAAQSVTIVENGTSYMGFSVNSTATLSSLVFDASCSVNIYTSSDFEPSGVYYSSPGEIIVGLTAIDAGGVRRTALDTVTVTADTAPISTFTIDPNRCISNPNTFTPSITGLTSYSWDFNNDGIEDSNAESPQVLFDTLGGPGTYTVRVEVSDGACNNFYEEEITIYSSPPAPSYDVSASRYCIGVDINFNNTTDDASYTGPLSYSWEFIDDATSTVEGTSTEENPTFSFTSSGTKTVILTSSIPGCEETTQQTITINPSPTANFTATSVCQEEPLQFTNTSTNATTYFWDFGDGFTSTNDNPDHIFTAAGNYSVSLTATDINGCDNTITNEVSISAAPVPAFDFDIPCTSSDGIQFFDMSTVENADIVSWMWEVDGVEESTAQNPTILFDSEGIKSIGLTTTSSNGCESFYTEDIEILAAPQPEFDAQIACQGEASNFMDNTAFSGNIISYIWTIDGVDYNSENVNHIFENPGIYDVTLEVTGQNFCSESITKQVEVLQLPLVDFNVSSTCDNEILEASDLSIAYNDAIVSRTWLLDGAFVGNGTELFLNSLASGSYALTLELQTAAGCITSYSETLEINGSPNAAFTASKTYGLPNDRINFSNSSVGAVDYQWLLNGSPFGTSSEAESLTFSEVGTHLVSLVAQNSIGCIDTSSQEILIAVPVVDLVIGNLELVAENNTGRIFLEVQNFSNLPIEITEAEITLEDQFKITEQIEEFVGIGESKLVNLNIGVPLANSEPGYLCVNLVSQYEGYPDINPLNNEKCINVQPIIKVENPFPNPVTDRFRIKVIAPNGGDATLMLINSAGKIQIQKTFNATAGLNNFFVEMSTLDPGIYYVTIDIGGTTHKRKVIKL